MILGFVRLLSFGLLGSGLLRWWCFVFVLIGFLSFGLLSSCLLWRRLHIVFALVVVVGLLALIGGLLFGRRIFTVGGGLLLVSGE